MTDSFIQLALLPFVWSVVVWVIRHRVMTIQPDDVIDKACLSAMILAPILGILSFAVPTAVPEVVLPLPEWVHTGGTQPSVSALPAASISALSLLDWALACLTVIYFSGLGWSISRFAMGLRTLCIIDRTAEPNPALGIYVTSSSISAIASPSGKIIFSRALLSSLTLEQRQLIRNHEAAHLKRRDPAWFLLLAVIDCLFWFNPFVRLQTETCRNAAERACDDATLKAAPQMRSTYANSLMSVLKHTAGNALHCVPAAFSRPSKGDYRMRMTQIMRPSRPVRKSVRLTLVTALGLLLMPVGAVQIAMAQSNVLASDFEFTNWPVKGKLSSKYGPRIHPISKEQKFHQGMDFAAVTGTPVIAPVAGKVVRAEFNEGYGNVVDLDHGNGMTSRYSQLQTYSVAVGQTIASGDKIGEVGATGRYATGPHLHFEVMENGKHQDPATYFKGKG